MSNETSPESPVIAVMFATDLMFRSRVSATARAMGLRVAFASSMEALEKKLAAESPTRAFIDMDADGATDAIRLVARTIPPDRIVAFYAHVHDALRQAATDAGAGTIMTRGQFAGSVELLLGDD